MRAKALALLTLCQAAPALAQQPLVDPKTHTFTDRGAVVAMVASAQVAEQRCGIKNQAAAALLAGAKMNVSLNLRDKADAADVSLLNGQALGVAKAMGDGAWCKHYHEVYDKFLALP